MKLTSTILSAAFLLAIASCTKTINPGRPASTNTMAPKSAEEVSDTEDTADVGSKDRSDQTPTTTEASKKQSGTSTKISLVIDDSTNLKAKSLKEKIERLLSTYDIDDYLFKKNIIIVNGGASFSGETADDPIELGADLDDLSNERILMVLLHEETHWSDGKFATDPAFDIKTMNIQNWNNAMAAFQTRFSNIPTSPAQGGAGSQQVNLIHVMVNFLELQAGKRFVGEEIARKELCADPVYRAIYLAVMDNEDSVAQILTQNKLILEPYVPGKQKSCGEI